MRTSPELLTDILGVLGQINIKMDTLSGGGSGSGAGKSTDTSAAQGIGLNLGELVKDDKGAEKLKNTASAIKDLSTSLKPLSGALIRFALVPRFAKRSLINFIKDLLTLGTPKQAKTAKTAAESIGLLGNTLPKLASGARRFGLMQKLGLVKATSTGLISLGGALAAIGNPATLPLVNAGAKALKGLGATLSGIAEVLSSVAKVVLAFAGAITILVGAIWATTKLFKVGPLAAMGIIVGSIAILAGGFALIGLLGGPIAKGGIAIKELGIGLGVAGAALLVYVGSLALINKITKGQEHTDTAIKSSLKSLVLLSLVFAGLGLIGGMIAKGGIAIQQMGKGMLIAGIGLLALGGVYGLVTNVFNVNMLEMMTVVAKGLAFLSLAFAGIGLLSPFILAGTAAMGSIAIAIGIFALVALGVGALISQLGGTEGLVTMTDNISLLIGGVLGGVIKGVSRGLLGEDGSSKSFFGKVGTVAKNVAILVGSIGLLIGVSFALMMFAFAIKAFTKAGTIKTVTGYKDNGEPIYGDSVNVVSAGENIARSIGSFFTTLTTTFKDPSIIPNKDKIEEMIDILMGNQGFKILGLKFGKTRPGLIDALSKFAELINIFAKVNKIPVYDIDKKGQPIIASYTTPKVIAKNIVDTLVSFFDAFKEKSTSLENLSTATSQTVGEVLLGQEAGRFLGLKVGKDKRGVLEPILKFSEVLTQYSKFGTDNKLPVAFDDKGKATEWVKVDDIAKNMVSGISTFISKFNEAFTGDKIKSVSDQSSTLDTALGKFTAVIGKFDTLSKSVANINKLGDSIGKLAQNVGLLVSNMSELNAENLESLSNVAATHVAAVPETTSTPVATGRKARKAAAASTEQTDWDAIADKMGQRIAEKLVGMRSGEFNFTFFDGRSGGKLEIKEK